MDSEEDQQFNGILHESAHLLRLEHSRILSQSPGQDDYGDQWDIGSCLGCFGTTSPWGANGFRGAGPGSNVVQRDTAGWIAAGRKTELNNGGACTQSTVTLAALNHPEVTGFLEAKIPAAIFIQKIGTSTTTDHYAVELREKSGWDAGIPADAVLVHLHGQDDYSYLVDQSGLAGAGSYFHVAGPAMGLGDEYVDLPNKTVIAVNRMDASAHTGAVTLASCKINVSLSNLGPASADFGDAVTLAADLKVNGSNAPVPNHPVTLSVGSQSCSGTTDAAGHATCQITINQHPGVLHAERRLRHRLRLQPGERVDAVHDQQGADDAHLHGRDDVRLPRRVQRVGDPDRARRAGRGQERDVHTRRGRHLHGHDQLGGRGVLLDHAEPGTGRVDHQVRVRSGHRLSVEQRQRRVHDHQGADHHDATPVPR